MLLFVMKLLFVGKTVGYPYTQQKLNAMCLSAKFS